MEVELQQIEMKDTDFKVCEDCGCFNWYENDVCCRCFSENKDGKAHFRDVGEEDIKTERNFWIKEEGYTEEETDHTMIEV